MLLDTIAALREGDTFIFQQVFAQYHKKLYFYMLGKTKSSYLSEEAVQLTFIKLWQYEASLNEEISLSIQLFRIARTTLIDLLRSNEYNNRIFVEMSPARKQPLCNNVDERIDESELKEKVLKGVQQMPAMRRKIFELSRFCGMSYKEIAVELSLSVKTVEHHISRALKQLQHIISILAPLFRWGLAQQVINAEESVEPGLDGIQPNQTRNWLLPIPDIEKDYNPNCVVNNGWN